MGDTSTALMMGAGLLFLLALITKFWMKILRVNFSFGGANSLTMFLLPQVTFLITFVIRGDLALSLGLVGALSIVRFRNPVRSSIELAVYFFLIGAGIAATVNPFYVIYFGALISGLAIVAIASDRILPGSGFTSEILGVDHTQLTEYVLQIESSKYITWNENPSVLKALKQEKINDGVLIETELVFADALERSKCWEQIKDLDEVRSIALFERLRSTHNVL